ncbi:cytochrome P450 76M5-like [Panicum miliaceum]|uniref:Cytochrome P450 76M5-like n=1 Tax=Panicum miliaceum TaxID=4540 RepID=A0A3L6TRC5_PANMI|nr:cytochrome P450 76M5-like [Panicum miliaceum]
MEHEVWLLWATLAVSLLYCLASLRRRHGSGLLPLGPRPLPVIGNALDLRRGHLHHTLARLARTYGPVMRLQLGRAPAVAISSRDAAREAFTRRDRRLTGRNVVDAVRALGWADRSMLNMPSSNPLWKLQRGILATHARRGARRPVAHFRARAGQEVDVGRALSGGMINLVSSTFFSVDVVDLDAAGCESAHGIREHVENIADLMTKPNVSDLFPFLRPLDLQGRGLALGGDLPHRGRHNRAPRMIGVRW